MRLKQLELQGYKTFAVKTNFLFKGGLTAIVGPNGSGKSNVADAIQWVLGEQTYGRLRAKRSEDMIFSGSNERARLGMAQASLMLDNADGWLPVDYGEVVITRRAYRSGENEYYLNGTRVRLRDITELLSQSGLSKRTYTVIGQGLIDQALSLKPDERRALIEEAAGITGHQAKRDTALRELDETRQNLLRVQDILSEIEPRLRYLKVQAKRAEERMQVLADLDAQLRVWYGHRWHNGLQQMHTARQKEEQARIVVEARLETLLHLEEQDSNLRQRYAALRNQLGDWHRESSALHRQAETAQREMAVGSERSAPIGGATRGSAARARTTARTPARPTAAGADDRRSRRRRTDRLPGAAGAHPAGAVPAQRARGRTAPAPGADCRGPTPAGPVAERNRRPGTTVGGAGQP